MFYTGFACIRMFYDSVNESDRKMRRIGNTVVVENSSALHGLDYMWQVGCLVWGILCHIGSSDFDLCLLVSSWFLL